MGDWVETEIGFVNFDQILVFAVEPPLPEPEEWTFTGKPKGEPEEADGVRYTVRGTFADGREREIWADLTWSQAWRICFGWREMLRKQGQGGSAVGYGIAAGF